MNAQIAVKIGSAERQRRKPKGKVFDALLSFRNSPLVRLDIISFFDKIARY